jgi:hypothetical protein
MSDDCKHETYPVKGLFPGVEACRLCGANVAVSDDAKRRQAEFCRIVDDWVAGGGLDAVQRVRKERLGLDVLDLWRKG